MGVWEKPNIQIKDIECDSVCTRDKSRGSKLNRQISIQELGRDDSSQELRKQLGPRILIYIAALSRPSTYTIALGHWVDKGMP